MAQRTFTVRTDAFTDAVPATGGCVVVDGRRAKVTFGARVAAIVAALPAAERPAAIVAAVAAQRTRDAAGFKPAAGAGRVDMYAWCDAHGGDANGMRATLRATSTRAARGRGIARPDASA